MALCSGVVVNVRVVTLDRLNNPGNWGLVIIDWSGGKVEGFARSNRVTLTRRGGVTFGHPGRSIYKVINLMACAIYNVNKYFNS